MKLNKALRGYYLEQVDAATITGAVPVVKTKGRGAGLPVFTFAFHAVLIGLMVTAMISGYYNPSRLEERMGVIIDRYDIQDRMIDSLEDLIVTIKKGKSRGGKL